MCLVNLKRRFLGLQPAFQILENENKIRVSCFLHNKYIQMEEKLTFSFDSSKFMSR